MAHMKASELQPGMIVLSHGMRVELLERFEYAGHTASGPVFHFPGRVLNVEEVDENGLIPRVWRGEHGDEWAIQSNDLFGWEVEDDVLVPDYRESCTTYGRG